MATMTMLALQLTKRFAASVAFKLAKAGRLVADVLDAIAEARMLSARTEIERYRRTHPDRTMPLQTRH